MAESQTPELIPPLPAPQEEGLAAVADALPTFTVEEAAPPPLGRTWAFDTKTEEFVRVGSQAPRQITGTLTLVQWIDKALRSSRGALPIHPDGYGMQDPEALFGRPIRELSVQELQRRIEDTLTFHPRIAAVVNVRLERVEEAAFVHYQVQLDPPLDEAEVLSLRLDLGGT